MLLLSSGKHCKRDGYILLDCMEVLRLVMATPAAGLYCKHEISSTTSVCLSLCVLSRGGRKGGGQQFVQSRQQDQELGPASLLTALG